ncbi:hypothetical protein AB6869_25040 [Rahnella rivi]|uniref:hypothetical protein n=1 Tax=Rahnella TaxID=34037 RepID=UPI0006FA8A04|nr:MULTISPECIES: hypothetical protein [Rahnella]KQN52781.1 hypothetical protein ASE99_11745 [Serratia sp. Leaf51]MBB6116461.1 hypothetical protein [Rahnella inusitata]MBU9831792.1 hypothetical protein [Rahnella rivi]THD46872.1 hypothetical protein ERD95_15575 [Enterobacteriaceae bacterium ML5]
MAEKDAYSILLEASHGKLCSADLYKGKPISSVINVALDAIIDLETEVKRLKFLLRQRNIEY